MKKKYLILCVFFLLVLSCAKSDNSFQSEEIVEEEFIQDYSCVNYDDLMNPQTTDRDDLLQYWNKFVDDVKCTSGGPDFAERTKFLKIFFEYTDITQTISGITPNHLAYSSFVGYCNDERVNIIAVEAAGKGIDSGESAATSVLGKEGIIHGSKTLLMQTHDGQITEPYSISAGLDYPGIGPMHAHLYRTKRAEFISIPDQEAMDWGLTLSQMEGIIPAIETAHAFAVLDIRKFKEHEIIVFNCSGRGDKDLDTYIEHFKL